MTINEEYNLIGGPHDGATVVEIKGKIPQTIYLNGIINAGTHSTWATKPSSRFKYCYELDGSKFKFRRQCDAF